MRTVSDRSGGSGQAMQSQMGHRDALCAFGFLLTCGDLMHSMQDISGVIPIAAHIANTDDHVLQDDKTAPMLEHLAVDQPRLH